jgi:hypothetical protein
MARNDHHVSPMEQHGGNDDSRIIHELQDSLAPVIELSKQLSSQKSHNSPSPLNQNMEYQI